MILIGNGNLITMDTDCPFIEKGAVLIDGEKIIEVDQFAKLKKAYPKAQIIDAKGGIIMPALINAHHHIYSSFARGMNLKGPSSKNFIEILNNLWWKLDKGLNLLDVRYSAYQTYIDCIKNGVTTVFDHHASYGSIPNSLFTISDVAKELGLRTSLCFEVSDRAGKQKAKAAIKENTEFIKEMQDSDKQKGMMGLHASFTLSDETLELCKKSMPYDAGYHIHVAEDKADVYDSMEKHGKPIVNRLYDADILGTKTIAVHCVHINPQEMDILKETKTKVVHNPESNMGNAVGCPPVLKMFKKEITIGLGTDGYTSDMFESLKVANILHKHNNFDPSVAWSEIPSMLFEHNRSITAEFFDDALGILQDGASADIIILDYIPHTPMDETNYNSHILFGLCGRSVTHTIASGKVLMQDRKLINIDEEKIMAKARELAKALWLRL